MMFRLGGLCPCMVAGRFIVRVSGYLAGLVCVSKTALLAAWCGLYVLYLVECMQRGSEGLRFDVRVF